MNRVFTTSLLASLVLVLPSVRAVDVEKADNSTALNVGTSWAGGTAPTSADTAVWSSAVTSAISASLGADTAWYGMKLSGAVGAQTIANASSANTLSLGAGGIDYTGSVASSGLVIQSKVLLTASQTWNITNNFTGNTGAGSGFNQSDDLAFAAQASNTAFDLGGNTVTITGGGTVLFTSGYAISNGTFDLSGGNTGTLVIQSGNSRNVSNSATVLLGTGSTLRLQVNSNAGGTAVAQTGAVTISGGTLLLTTNGGSVPLSVSGTITTSTTTSVIQVAGSLTGVSGNGPVNVSSNITGTGTLTLSNTSGSIANPIFSGIISNNGSALTISKAGSNNITLTGVNTYTGATQITAGTLTLGATASIATSSGVTITGGTLAITAGANTGTFSINSNVSGGGGIIRAATTDAVTLNNAINFSTSTIFGSVTTGRLLITGNVALGSANTAKTMTIENERTEFSGVLSGSTNTLTKAGAGTMVVSGANTYTKNTAVTAGSLLVNGTHTIASAGSYTVSSGAILGGTGTISGSSTTTITVNTGGALMVGNTHGAVTGADTLAQDISITGNNIILAGTLQFDLFGNASNGGLNSATANDKLLLNSTGAAVDLTGSTLSVTNLSGQDALTWLEGTRWQLISWNGLATGTPTYTLNTDIQLAKGLTWGVTTDAAGLYIGVFAVPEPGRAVLMMLGVGMVGARRRRGR